MPRRLIARRELLAGAATALGCSVERPREGFLGAMDRFNERTQELLFDPERLARPPDVSEITPPDVFPAYKIGSDYPRPPGDWALEIAGSGPPRRFTLGDLQRLTRTDMRVRHHCVEGWSAVASWHGVRLTDVARLVGAPADALYVEFTSFEPVAMPDAERAPRADAKSSPDSAPPRIPTYMSSWDRASALHPQTLLAYGMNGDPLDRLHGGPVRLYSSTKLGYKMVKWLSSIRFLTKPTGGYWEDQGYEWFAGV